MKLEFSRYSFEKNFKNFIQTLPVIAEIFHADRQTDTTKLSVDFRNFANKPKNA